MKTHVCLVSDQPIPNILPILQERPDRVILLETAAKQQQSRRLQRFLKDRDLADVEVQQIDPFDFAAVQQVCSRLVESGQQLTLNATGGTKIAAFAAFQQFYFNDLRIIYTDTNSNSLLELGENSRTIPLDDNLLTVKDYLACYGMTMKSGLAPGGETSRRKATSELAKLLCHNEKLLTELNGVIYDFKTNSKDPYLSLESPLDTQDSSQLLQLLRKAKIGTPGADGAVNLNNEKELFYAGGGWLEEYVYGIIKEKNVPGLDVRMNVNIVWDGEEKSKKQTSNELDVLFTWHNRLHVISCKTSQLDRGQGQKGKESMYELETLSGLIGGLFARRMLVSAVSLRDYSLQRAKDMRLNVVDGNRVFSLSRLLDEVWLQEKAG